MAFALTAAPEWRCIFVKWSGRFLAEELAAYTRALEAEPLFHSGAPVFHDARNWDLNVPTAELLTVARNPVRTPRGDAGPRRAAFLAADALGYGMLRVIATLRERPDLTIKVFYDLEEAKTWLGLARLPGDPFAGAEQGPA